MNSQLTIDLEQFKTTIENQFQIELKKRQPIPIDKSIFSSLVSTFLSSRKEISDLLLDKILEKNHSNNQDKTFTSSDANKEMQRRFVVIFATIGFRLLQNNFLEIENIFNESISLKDELEFDKEFDKKDGIRFESIFAMLAENHFGHLLKMRNSIKQTVGLVDESLSKIVDLAFKDTIVRLIEETGISTL